jgi:hypothetical protein
MMKMMKTSVWTTATAMCLVAGAAHAAPTLSQSAMSPAVKKYVNDHSDLCVGKPTWPRFVTEDDRRANTNDALQMPVLERLGLVESADVSPTLVPQATGAAATAASAPVAASDPAGPAKRYSLTAKGRKFYLRKKMTTLGAHGRPIERTSDFCVAHLSLDRVIKWTPPEEAHGHLETVVSYTYQVKAADWMADPEARKVFPVVDRIIRGAGNVLMTATLQAQNDTWVPVLPGQ